MHRKQLLRISAVTAYFRVGARAVREILAI